MTEADRRDDIIFELHLAELGDRNAVLVRLVREHPELREELVDHFCEIVWMEWRAAAVPAGRRGRGSPVPGEVPRDRGGAWHCQRRLRPSGPGARPAQESVRIRGR
ncbi:hypothetical protein MBRA_05267 [Methylobacterium brachiatum]|nr:hypothetical protein MBRA_05267 [Methylobacterium brachiatum]